MAGKIALGINAVVLLIALGYGIRWGEEKSTVVEFQVESYVDREGAKSSSGIDAPYTIAVYQYRIHKVIPGYVGEKGDKIEIPLTNKNAIRPQELVIE
jgi:hypothetical protein